MNDIKTILKRRGKVCFLVFRFSIAFSSEVLKLLNVQVYGLRIFLEESWFEFDECFKRMWRIIDFERSWQPGRTHVMILGVVGYSAVSFLFEYKGSFDGKTSVTKSIQKIFQNSEYSCNQTKGVQEGKCIN
jgi:hypothetical protein